MALGSPGLVVHVNIDEFVVDGGVTIPAHNSPFWLRHSVSTYANSVRPLRPYRSSQRASRVRLVMTSPGRMRAPYVGLAAIQYVATALALLAGDRTHRVGLAGRHWPRERIEVLGATMPPHRVVAAYSASQYRRGGVSGQ